MEESGAKISVVQYFQQQYNIRLKYTNLPAIQAGNAAKPMSLPMEVSGFIPTNNFSSFINLVCSILGKLA